MIKLGFKQVACTAALSLALLGCTPLDLSDDTTKPEAESQPAVPSARSQELSRYYARLQQDLLVQGLLRRDGGGPDTPFDARDLERNFISIALFDEYRTDQGQLIAEPVASRLRRWNRPIRMSLRFGATVPVDQQEKDRTAVKSYTARLSSLIDLPIRLVRTGGNFTVLFLNEDERRAFQPQLEALIPGLDQATLNAFVDMPRSTLCYVIALTDTAPGGTYRQAVAIIRAEHPDLLRLSCIHEEIAQGLGLANDSPSARPSIFNDNEEFGLLTQHDALLLQMLYDPRLKTGMTEKDARPLVQVIAAEVLDRRAGDVEAN